MAAPSPSPPNVHAARWFHPPQVGHDHDIESGGQRLATDNVSSHSIFSIEPCLGHHFHSQNPKVQVIGNNKRPSTTHSLEAIIAIIAMGSTTMVGLMGLSFSPNKGVDDAHQTALFDAHNHFFCYLVLIGVATFYLVAIGAILFRLHPTIAQQLNHAALVLAVLAVTMLLWVFLPKMFRWVPWIFFAITISAGLVMQFVEWANRRRSANKISRAGHDDGCCLPTIYSPSVILRNSSHQILIASPSCPSRLPFARSASV